LGTYEVAEHTADVRLIAVGRTLEDALATTAEALFHVIAGESEVVPGRRVPVRVEAPDLESLVVEWLNELVYICDVEGVLLKGFEVEITGGGEGPYRLQAVGYGEDVDPGRHGPLKDVKAATYHGLRIERDGDRWSIEVVCDI